MIDHMGNPLSADRDLFAPAPPEIGTLVSAFSTLLKSESPSTKASQKIAKRAAIGGVAGLSLAFAGAQFWLIPAAAAVGALAGLRSRQVLSYVGERGVARFQLSRDRSDTRRTLLFLFQSARTLRRSGTVKYMNGIYSGTNWSFTWSDERGKTVGGEAGEYYLTPKPYHPYHFWQMAERAWSTYLLNGPIQQEFHRTGAIRFDIKPPNWVTVGQGFIELSFNGKIARCEQEDIQSISLNEGLFTIKRKDSKVGWFSSTGLFTFEYGRMPNALIFRLLVTQLLGVTMGA